MRKDRMVREVLGEELALTPSDICNQDFRQALVGGYRSDEVDTFLERVADMFEGMLQQLRELRARNEEQRAALEQAREMEDTLRSALVSSQRFSEEIVATAKREAQALLEEARAKQAQAQLEAARLPGRLSRDIHLMERQRARLRSELLAIIETHRRLLDSLIPENSLESPSSFFDVGGAEPGAEVSETASEPGMQLEGLDRPADESPGGGDHEAESAPEHEGSDTP